MLGVIKPSIEFILCSSSIPEGGTKHIIRNLCLNAISNGRLKQHLADIDKRRHNTVAANCHGRLTPLTWIPIQTYDMTEETPPGGQFDLLSQFSFPGGGFIWD